MRTHTLLGGFLDVQDDGPALGRHGKRSGQARTPLASYPLLLRVEVSNVADADQLHEVLLARLVRAAHRRVRLLQLLLGGEGGHATCHGLGLHGAEPIREG